MHAHLASFFSSAPAKPGSLLDHMRARGTAAALGNSSSSSRSSKALPAGVVAAAPTPLRSQMQAAPRVGTAAAASSGFSAGGLLGAACGVVGALVGAVTGESPKRMPKRRSKSSLGKNSKQKAAARMQQQSPASAAARAAAAVEAVRMQTNYGPANAAAQAAAAAAVARIAQAQTKPGKPQPKAAQQGKFPLETICLESPASKLLKAKRKTPGHADSNAKAARMEMPAPTKVMTPRQKKQQPAAKRPVSIRVVTLAPLPPKDTQDNYELSDREGSDGEIADCDRSTKKIPAWCKEFQECVDKQHDVNPDSVFGTAVPQCDIDDIFPDSLYKSLNLTKVKRARGSSCVWHQDGLRMDEVESYAKKMGHSRKLGASLRRASRKSFKCKVERLGDKVVV